MVLSLVMDFLCASYQKIMQALDVYHTYCVNSFQSHLGALIESSQNALRQTQLIKVYYRRAHYEVY